MALSGKGARAKGQQGERELFALLTDQLGFVVRRKVVNRKGDPDGVDVPGWAVEVKRFEREHIPAWWRQTEEQAALIARKPILFFRASRRPWQAVVDLSELNPMYAPGRFQICLPLEAACQLMSETLPDKIMREEPCSTT